MAQSRKRKTTVYGLKKQTAELEQHVATLRELRESDVMLRLAERKDAETREKALRAQLDNRMVESRTRMAQAISVAAESLSKAMLGVLGEL